MNDEQLKELYRLTANRTCSRAAKLVEALEETQGLLVAMLHETRPHEEIEVQIGDNRTALQSWQARAASPQPVAQTERALTVDHAVACMKEALIEPKWNVTAGEIADVLKRTRALLTAPQPDS